MRIFVFEFITGGGLLPASAPLTGEVSASADLNALAVEGQAMIAALVADFATLPETTVTTLRDHRWHAAAPAGVVVRTVTSDAECRVAFDELAAQADQTIVIAPECGGALAELVARATQCGGRHLGPGPELVRLASDKHATAEHLAQSGIPAPRGQILEPDSIRDFATALPAALRFPLVLKPRDGAGSQGVRLIAGPAELNAALAALQAASQPASNWRIETFHPGLAVSVALLCGPDGCHALPPCAQQLSDDGRFSYRGGRLPLAPAQAERAARLAQRAVATLPRPRGYLGVDLVLGSAADGADDVLIEINPRLTTSYVGLRALARDNLAAAMLEVAAGRAPRLSFHTGRVEFASDGTTKLFPRSA